MHILESIIKLIINHFIDSLLDLSANFAENLNFMRLNTNIRRFSYETYDKVSKLLGKKPQELILVEIEKDQTRQEQLHSLKTNERMAGRAQSKEGVALLV